MSTTSTQPQFKLVGFRYDGSLPKDFLLPDELATTTGSDGNCVITSPRGHTRLKPGAFISRRPDGSLFTTGSAS